MKYRKRNYPYRLFDVPLTMLEKIPNKLRKWNAIHYPQRVFQSPQWLVLGVNNTCNLHCKMCDVGVNYAQSNFFENLMGSKPVHMPIDLFKKIVDQAYQHFPKVKLGYAFTEPLVYVHLEESMRYARQNNFFISLTTNGLGLKRWARVLNDNLDEVNISLDGPPEIHNYIRGNDQSYAKAIEGIEALMALKSTVRINVYCVITEWNTGQLVRFLEGLSPYPLHRVGLMHSNFTPQHIADHHNQTFGGLYPATTSNITDTHNDQIDRDVLWNEIQAIKKRRWNFAVDFFPEIAAREKLDDYYLRPEVFIGRRCMDIFSNLMIKSNGDVIPAHGRCFNLKVGNLYESSLPEIWNSATLASFRGTVSKHGGLLPACSRCCSSFIR